MMTPRPPGIHDGIPEPDYHRDTWALSASGAKLLLPPNCPARFKYTMIDHPNEDTRQVFQFGKAAHRTVLGVGPDIVYVAADSWRTKAAKDKRAQAEARGAVALLEETRGVIEAMVAALRAHPLASALFSEGRPEQSLYFQDPESAVMLRGRLDWLRPPAVTGRYLIVDYKTADSADPEVFGRKAIDYAYHLSAQWYRRLVMGLGLADDPAFLHVVQEKEPPYLVTVCQIPGEALRIADRINRRAINRYAECQAADTWPGYSDHDVAVAPTPAYYLRQFEDVSL
jgi:PDDEXK-like domain of unknown function (DUF3799)